MADRTEQAGVVDTAVGGGASALIGLIIANTTVCVSSFCVMVIELVAGRLIAPYVGSSLHTWTAIIGAVLAGLAVGNYFGGRVADRYATGRRATRRTLALLFLIAAVVSSGIGAYNDFVGELGVLVSLESLPLRVAVHVVLVFTPPSLLLGLISPVVAKMALDLGRKTGRTIGSVYAWGVVGSIIGTFMTGFWFVLTFATPLIVLAAAGVLGLTGVFYGVSSLAARD